MNHHYWVTTAALEHVHIVKEKGYTQVNMGPKEPLEKMKQGDWILYYSPTVYYKQPESLCQKFSGISKLIDEKIYPQDPKDPILWRRNAQFYNCIPHHAQQFHTFVDFLKQHDYWVDAFKKSVFEISQSDFLYIAKKIIVPVYDISIFL